MTTVALANLLQRTPDQVMIAALPSLPARLEFNASWGLTSGGVVEPGLMHGRTLMASVHLYREPGANLYAVMFASDLAGMAELQPVAFHALRFAAPIGLGGHWL